MKRKLLSVLLSALMVMTLLAGCSKKAETTDTTGAGKDTAQETQEPASEGTTDTADTTTTGTADPQLEKTIKILSIWAEDNDNGVLINNICKRYKEQVNPNFNFEYELVSADDLKMKISTLAASNDLPDIFVYESGAPLVELIDAGKVVDVGAELTKLGLDSYMNPSAVSLLKSLSGTDTIYDLPLGLNVEGFWYNKALFEQAGVTAPTTWDEFETVLAKLKEAGIQPLSCGAGDKWGATRLINAYTVRTLGADALTKAANGETKYTDAGYVTGAAKIQEWAEKGYFGEGVTTVDMNTAGSMLCTGKAAIFYNGSWFTSSLNDATYNQAGEDGIGFFNVPVVDASISDADSYSMNCGNILALGKDKYDEATSWFLKYFVSQIGDEAMNVQGSVKGYTYTADDSQMSGYTKLVLDKINSAKTAFTWYESKMNSETSTVAQENVQTLINGDMTPEDYMQSIQDAYDSSR